MIKNYLLYSCMGLANTLFAYKEIKIAPPNISEPRAVTPTSYKLPEGFTQENCMAYRYGEMDGAIQNIVEYLWKGDHQQVVELVYKKKKEREAKYLILQFPRIQSYNGINTNYYCFVWEKKEYSRLTDLEKNIANSYNANINSKIKFLYSYLKPNSDPWAIMINNRIHATIWVTATTTVKPSHMHIKDPFLVLDPQDEKKTVLLLIDENNQAIAKRINENTFFRKNI